MKVFFAETAMVLTTLALLNVFFFFSDSHAGQFFRDLRPGREFTANIIDTTTHPDPGFLPLWQLTSLQLIFPSLVRSAVAWQGSPASFDVMTTPGSAPG